MLTVKVKVIIKAIIIIALCCLYLSEEKTPEIPPIGNTIYVQSGLPGECRAIITPILGYVKSASSEILCKVKLRSKK